MKTFSSRSSLSSFRSFQFIWNKYRISNLCPEKKKKRVQFGDFVCEDIGNKCRRVCHLERKVAPTAPPWRPPPLLNDGPNNASFPRIAGTAIVAVTVALDWICEYCVDLIICSGVSVFQGYLNL